MKQMERILLVLYLFAFMLKIFEITMNNLIFTSVSIITILFYSFGSWYFLGLPYNKLISIVQSIVLGIVYSFAFIALLFRMEQWAGAETFFYLSEAVLIITMMIIYQMNKISRSIKSFLLIRCLTLFGLNLVAIAF
jgi:hypothetical protein